MMFSKRSPISLFVMTCLALLLCAAVTIDTVIDLVFEHPDIAISAEPSSDQEEPDSGAEHLLMPSQRDEGSVSLPLISPRSVDFEASTHSLRPTDTILRARSNAYNQSQTKSSSVPLLLPLRI